jgi:hypothetical protein
VRPDSPCLGYGRRIGNGFGEKERQKALRVSSPAYGIIRCHWLHGPGLRASISDSRCACRKVRWVRPEIVAHVRHLNWTTDGLIGAEIGPLATRRGGGKAMRYCVLISLVLAVASCNDTIKLRNGKTGQEITCGGGMSLPGRAPDTARCVKLMEEAGYKKVNQER